MQFGQPSPEEAATLSDGESQQGEAAEEVVEDDQEYDEYEDQKDYEDEESKGIKVTYHDDDEDDDGKAETVVVYDEDDGEEYIYERVLDEDTESPERRRRLQSSKAPQEAPWLKELNIQDINAAALFNPGWNHNFYHYGAEIIP